jgi:hypothetical protein
MAIMSAAPTSAMATTAWRTAATAATTMRTPKEMVNAV